MMAAVEQPQQCEMEENSTFSDDPQIPVRNPQEELAQLASSRTSSAPEQSQHNGEIGEIRDMSNDPELPGRNAQESLARLASSLMMAAAEQGRTDGEVEESSIERHNGSETMPMNPTVKKARKLLFRRLRVGVEDSRVFVGKFHCLDKQGNIILYDTVEYRQISPPAPSGGENEKSGGVSGGVEMNVAEGATTEQRSLGLVLIPARCRTSCHVECSLQEQFSLLSV